MPRETSGIGDKLLPKIIHAVSQVIITTRRGLLPWDHYVRVKATQDIIDRIGHEVAEHWGPHARKLLEADTGSLSPDLRKLLEDSISGEHQLKAVTGLLVGPVSGAIGTLISNELAPLVYQLIRLSPNLDMDVQSAANAAAQRIITKDQATSTLADQGYFAGIAETYYELAQQYPSMADALEMSRRNLISDGELKLAAERNAIPDAFIGPSIGLKSNLLTLADAALAYLRSDISLGQAQEIARTNGYSNDQLSIFIGNTGEPPGLMQLLEGLRRGFIDEATVVRGIKQSRYRNEWIDLILKLRYEPISVADAVNAVVQNHLDMAAGDSIAQQNGLEPGQFSVLYETAGEPLSRTEMGDLVNRGEATLDEMSQALRESRLKNKYIGLAEKLRVRLLEPRILSSAVEFGSITHADAIKQAMDYGYSEANATVLVGSASNRKLYSRKQAIVTAAETLYIDNAITETQLREAAKSADFHPSEVDVIVAASEYRRRAKWITTVLSVIRSKYVSHHFDQAAATHYVDSLGIPAERRNELFTVWDMERAATTAELTTAQILKAVKLQLISPEDGKTRLLRKGYDETDAKLLLEGA